jgi:hypothetical protein
MAASRQKIQDADRPKERTGDCSSDWGAEVLQLRQVSRNSSGSKDDRDRQGEHRTFDRAWRCALPMHYTRDSAERRPRTQWLLAGICTVYIVDLYGA